MTQNKILQFISPRAGSNIWAQRADLVEAWRRQSFESVMPLTVEYAPILDCNADCPLCPYARSRRQAKLSVVSNFKFPKANDHTVATKKIAKRVVAASFDAGVTGILWTGGGEPLIWEPLLDMLRYSGDRGIVNGIYSNGFMLGHNEQLAEQLLDPANRLIFVRISINAVKLRTIRLHWGVEPEEVLPQLLGLDRLFRARERLLPLYRQLGQNPPFIEISTILNKSNVDDLTGICEAVGQIAKAHKFIHKEDIMVVRPLTIHGRRQYSTQDHRDSVIKNILAIGGQQGPGRRIVENAGLKFRLGFGLELVDSGEAKSFSEVVAHEYSQRDCSWANGVFLTVGPDGQAYLSTEHNCDPDWAIGDLKTQSVSEIYSGKQRRKVVERVKRYRWGPEVCQATSRTARLDRIAKAIMSGELSDNEITRIREHSLNEPALLLD